MKTPLVDFLQDELKIGEIPAHSLRISSRSPSVVANRTPVSCPWFSGSTDSLN